MKKRILILLSCLLSFLLVSCGGSKTAEKSAAAPKDTLVFAQISECKTLDPQDTTEQYSQRIINVLYDRLVEVDEMTGEIVPGLAKSWERIDDNTLLFHLNENVNFIMGKNLQQMM